MPRFEGPCTVCHHKADCSVYPELAQHLFPRVSFQKGEALDSIDKFIVEGTRKWISEPGAPLPAGRPWTVRLAVLFDLAASLLYARDLVSFGSNGTFSFKLKGVLHGSHITFPYTWICPLCIADHKSPGEAYLPEARAERIPGEPARDFPIVSRLAKPRSRAIGDVGIKVLLGILHGSLELKTSLRLSSGGGRRGEFDATIANDQVLVFGEVKAKPLLAFPLVATLQTPIAAQQHAWVEVPPCDTQLFIGATKTFIPLGRPDSPEWPLNRLPGIAAQRDLVARIETAWYLHLEAYRKWTNEPDYLRWVRFGCGNFRQKEDGVAVEKRVANTKELPGLDRTDDIKKGATQMLLFSRFKSGCKTHALRSALIGNTYAETHENDYLAKLAHLRLSEPNGGASEFIFDVILGLTKNVINTDKLDAIIASPPWSISPDA